MKRIILIFSILLAAGATGAQNINLRATAPATVAAGSQFRLEFSINADAKDLRIDNIPDFDVLMGPSTSKSSNISIVNGNVNQSVSTTFTYVLQAQKEGTFNLPAATVMVDKEKYTSNTLKINVVTDNNAQQNSGQSSPTQSNIQTISGVEVFIRTIPSKTTVYEQEAVLITYKLYVRGVANVFRVQGTKTPEAKEFISQDVLQPDDKQFSSENYNGKDYNVVVLDQRLLYPQRAGSLNVEEGEYESALRIVNSSPHRSFFSSFFDTYQDVTRKITAPAVKITVKELPTGKPVSFANAVGNFSLKSSINTTELKENEPISLTISISGNGNFRLIKNPEIKFPNDFEIYDPKVDAKLKNTTAGVTGSRTIEYLAIPRHAGNFTIPATEFSYFDLASQTYKTLRTETYEIKVAKGNGAQSDMQSFVNKENVRMLGNDIRYINTTDTNLKLKNDFLFGSILFIFSYLVSLLLAIVLFVVFRKQATENANIVLTRNKKANKVATKRLKIAQKHLQQNEKEKFYDETLKALWGYFSDKFSIPVAGLTKDNIEIELSRTGADETLISDFKNILSTCEYARYAPAGQAGEMSDLYHLTVKKISELEQKIKR